MKNLVTVALFTFAAAPLAAETSWTVLGSGGGPVARADRSQPANLLQVNGRNIVVDAGDGLSVRLAAKRLPMGAIDDVVISHLHFDHMGGLLAVLGQRFQTNPRKPVAIYGPVGTKAVVDGLLAAMAPSMNAGYGIAGEPSMTAEQLVTVTEISGGDHFMLGDATVTAVENTHYGTPEELDGIDHLQSLSFRFDTADKSIVYTGDTGQSENVVALAEGADILVAELIDLPAVMEFTARMAPPESLPFIEKHLSAHHLSPEQLAELASAAHVGTLVATHLVAGPAITPEQTADWRSRIQAGFAGEVVIADDLSSF